MRVVSLLLSCWACSHQAYRVRAKVEHSRNKSDQALLTQRAHQASPLTTLLATPPHAVGSAAAFNPSSPGCTQGNLAVARERDGCRRHAPIRCGSLGNLGLANREKWSLTIGRREDELGDVKRARTIATLDPILAKLKPLNVKEYSLFIIAYTRVGGWKVALELFDEMFELRLKPDLYCFSGAIRACAKGGLWERALSMIDEIDKVGLKPNAHIHGGIIQACAKSGQWERGLALFDQGKDGFRNEFLIYNIALSACSEGKQWRRALSILEELKELGGEMTPTEITYNAAMYACTKAGQWEMAMSLFSEMIDVGLDPDSRAYTAAISAVAEGKQWQCALSLLQEMEEKGVPRDVVTYTEAVKACTKAGQTQQALLTFHDMVNRSVRPNVNSYTAAIAACQHAEDWRRALTLLNRMHHEGVKPNFMTYNSLMIACIWGGAPSSTVLALLDEMSHLKVAKERCNFYGAIEACKRAEEPKLALSLLYEMRESGFALPGKVCNAVMAACEKGGLWRRTLAILDLMVEQGIPINSNSFGIAMEACDRGGQWQRAVSLMQQIKEVNIRPSEDCFVAAMAACEKAGQREHTLALIDQMEGSGVLGGEEQPHKEYNEAVRYTPHSKEAVWQPHEQSHEATGHSKKIAVRLTRDMQAVRQRLDREAQEELDTLESQDVAHILEVLEKQGEEVENPSAWVKHAVFRIHKRIERGERGLRYGRGRGQKRRNKDQSWRKMYRNQEESYAW